jgi:hypothetical protein
VLEWRGFFARAGWPCVALPRPFELVEAGEGEAVEAACPADVEGPPDGVLPVPPPPGLGWPGTGAPGTGTETPPTGP